MDTGDTSLFSRSLNREDEHRPYDLTLSLQERLRQKLDRSDYRVAEALIKSFRILNSGIGLVSLAESTARDLASLKYITSLITVPKWIDRVGEIANPISKILDTDASRDLTALRNLPRHPLRDYLAPPGSELPHGKIRFLQAIRGLLTLIILSERGELATELARELSRWLSGKLPRGLEPAALTQLGLAQLAANDELKGPTVKLLNQLAAVLRSELPAPFQEQLCESNCIVAPATNSHHDDEVSDVESKTDESTAELEILEHLLAEQASGTRRAFAGVVTARELQPFELDQTFPKILALAGGVHDQEVFAAESAFHLGLMPSKFHLLEIGNGFTQGYAICAEGNAIRIDINRVIKHSSDSATADDRTVIIPFPMEFAQRIRAYLSSNPSAKTFAQLFSLPMDALQKSTRAMLRAISISSHRITLTRLARSRGRYALHRCRDEAYSALIGLDFLLGTPANFNYLSVRADRLKSILHDVYLSLGYSGVLATEDVHDVISPRQPNYQQVATLLSAVTAETSTVISSLPRHCGIDQLITAHNLVSTNIFILFKFISGSRPVKFETVTRSQINLKTGATGVTDKRVSPYHELRMICLPTYLIGWLETYNKWLESLAYRLSGIAPKLAAQIDSATRAEHPKDWHPLFFSLNESLESVPIGSQVLAGVLANYGMAINAGRHWIDAVARDAEIDSAAVMGQAGRGNPGQELFGRWSGAIPAIAFSSISLAIDQWIEQVGLPSVPTFNPRSYTGPGLPRDALPYDPKLIETTTGWMEQALPRGIAAPEPCPFSRTTVTLASNFAESFRTWRSTAPAPGWFGVARSLIMEDGVIHGSELLGAIAEIATGKIYVAPQRTFVDSKTRPLGLRRTEISTATLQLAQRIPPSESIPETLAALDTAPIPRVGVNETSQSIGELLAQAEAYTTLHFPAAISAWSRGLTFSRTTRPASEAREIFGCIEPPLFDLRPRARRVAALESVAKVLEQAKKKLDEGASHATALHLLGKLLEELRLIGSDSLLERIEVGYLQNLAGSLRNLNTLLRYESGARNFVRIAANAIEHAGADDIDWRQLVNAALHERKDGSAPDETGINSVLRYLGIDIQIFQRSAAPPSAFNYAEIVSPREIAVAIALLDQRQKVPGDDYHLATIALRLLARHPLRWDSVAHLRLGDLALDNPRPHLAITAEAGANLKTDNAVRVIRLTDPELVNGLLLLMQLRSARFPDDTQLPIFGDAHDPRTIERTGNIHQLITSALWHATGSPVVCVHDLRHRVITDRIHTHLTPGAHQKFDTLALRQGLIECAIEAGQSWPQVSMENYGHDMDRLRTQHYHALLADLTPPSDVFVSGITGVPATTCRKRRSRNPGYEPNLAEDFSWDNFRDGATILQLGSLIADGQSQVTFVPEMNERPLQTPRAIYLGLRLLGDSPEVARAVSGLTTDQGKTVELALASAPQRLGVPLQARKDINRQTFLQTAQDLDLAFAMSVAPPDRSSIARIEGSLKQAGDEWAFSKPRDALDLAPWIRIWAANDIATEFVLRPCGRSVVDNAILTDARSSGFSRARTLPARHFRRDVGVMLRFYPRPNSTSRAKRSRASPQTAFFLSTCAMAFHYQF
uniref:Uncharacterized protein n=1 Tax=Dechloromonas aromatica (strain RCB) TaxID=159087 RepID=Q47GA6_DECAR